MAWGNADDGGDCQEVQEQLRGVDRLYSSGWLGLGKRVSGSKNGGIRSQLLTTIPRMAFGTFYHDMWALGPSGQGAYLKEPHKGLAGRFLLNWAV